MFLFEMHREQSRFRVEELEVTLQESQSMNKSLVEEIQRNEQAHQEEVRALIEAKESAALEARKESEGLSANIDLLNGQLQMLQQTLVFAKLCVQCGNFFYTSALFLQAVRERDGVERGDAGSGQV